MSTWFSAALIVLFASQQNQPPGGREPAGQRFDDLVLVAEEIFQARVIDIVDGDSVLVQDGAKTIRVQLHGVDAPELSQPFGKRAQAFLNQLVIGKTLTVRRNGTGSGGAIAELDVDGTDVSAALVSAGLAWRCSRHAENQDLAAAEKAAKDARRGLWQEATPTPPWKHRGAAGCWDDGEGR